MSGTMRELLKPGEVCRRLAIGNDTLHRLIREGRLEAVQLGPKSTRVYADTVEELLNGGTSE